MRVSASDHCERTILFPVSILVRDQINEEFLVRNVESWESLSFADTSDLVWRRFLGFWCCLSYISCWCCRLYGFQEQAWAWQTPQTLCWEECFVAPAVRRLPGTRLLPGIMLPVAVQSKNEQSIEQVLTCRKHIHTCASSMSGESCPLMGCSCSNPIRIDHQCWRKGTRAGVSQWPLWENHRLHTFLPRQRSDQWRVSPLQCWKPSKLELGRHLKPCVGKWLSCWCCRVTVSRILSLWGIMLPVPVPSKNKQSIKQLVLRRKNIHLC